MLDRVVPPGFLAMGLRSVFKKIGKGIKKVLPYAGLALPFIPGVNAAASGLISKVSDAWGGGSAQSNAPPPFMGPPEEGSPSQSIQVTGQRNPEPGFDWKGALGAVAPIAAGAANYFGQKSTNVANAQQAQAQMDFQNQQTSTSYQRGVADMKAAGLNPMLAYSQGGASSGSGASAQMGNELGAGANSAQSAYLARQQMAQSAAQIDNTDSDTDLKNAQVDLTRQQALQTIASTKNLGTENARLVQEITRLGLGNTLDSLRQKDLARLASSSADLERARASRENYGLAEHEAESKFWKQYGSSYLNSSRLLEVGNSAKNLVNPLGGLFRR